MYLAILGYALVAVMMWGLLKEKLTPVIAFCTLPFLFGLLGGFNLLDLTNFAAEGVTKTLSATALGLFATAYFGVMTREGLFDPIVNRLSKIAGNNIIAIMIISVLVSSIAHMDTGTTSTVFVTIPAMMPLFKRYHIRLEYLFVIIAQAVSVINMLPHGGGMVRVSSLTGLDVALMVNTMFPVIIGGVVINLVMAVFYGRMETKRIATAGLAGIAAGGRLHSEDETSSKKIDLRYWLNLGLTITVLTLMFLNTYKSYIIFMIALSLALLINYSSTKLQNSVMKELAASSFNIAIVTLASGILVGVMTGTAMLTEMANIIVTLIPAALKGFFALIVAFTGVPLSIALGGDAFYFGLMPLFVEVANSYSIPAMSIAAVMMLAKDGFSMITPVSAVTHLAPGLMNIDLKDLMKFSFKYLFISFTLKVVLCVMLGIVPVFI